MSMLNFFPLYIKKFYGKEITKLNYQTLKSKFFIKKNGKLATFQRVRCTNEKFELFKYQDSSMQNILSSSDGIIFRNSYDKSIKKNEKVKILRFNLIDENYI